MKPPTAPMSREVYEHAMRIALCKRALLKPTPYGETLLIPHGCTGEDMAVASNELLNAEETESMVKGPYPVMVPDDHVEYAPKPKLWVNIAMGALILFGYVLCAVAGIGALRLAYLGVVWLGGGK